MIRQDTSTKAEVQEPTDEMLVREAQQGSQEAFSMLYERYLPSVYNRVRYVVPEDDIEDVVQEIFIAAMKSINSFKRQSKFSTWLRTLTNRRVADFYRKQKGDDVAMPENAGDTMEDSSARLRSKPGRVGIDDKIVLQDALAELPEHYQEVLLLRFAEGLKFHEIADAMDQSLEATKSLFRRAIAALKSELEGTG